MDFIRPELFDHIEEIDAIPEKEAIEAAVKLLEGCYHIYNHIWVCISRWKFWQIPVPWLTRNIQSILHQIEIDWEDECEYTNLFIVFEHQFELYNLVLKEAVVLAPHLENEIHPVLENKMNYYRQTFDYIYYLGLK